MQHYVPQFWLRNFSVKGKLINVYLIKHRKCIQTSPEAVFQKKFFYDTKHSEYIKDALKNASIVSRIFGNSNDFLLEAYKLADSDPQFIEHVLGRLEHNISHIFDILLKYDNGRLLQKSSIRLKLLIFIRDSEKRTKFNYDFMTSLLNKERKWVSKLSRNFSKNISLKKRIPTAQDMQIHDILVMNPNEVLKLSYKAKYYEFSLAKINKSNKNTFILGDNPTSYQSMKEFLLPISHYRGILIRPKRQEKYMRIYDSQMSKTNYVTRLNNRDVIQSNLMQLYKSVAMITGYRQSIICASKALKHRLRGKRNIVDRRLSIFPYSNELLKREEKNLRNH